MKLLLVAGARPNFMKIAPLMEALQRVRSAHADMEYRLVHTGQHYDERMSQAFFDDLGLPRPDVSLGVGSGTHAEQTANVMVAFERVLVEERPGWVVVVGDVNSTMACAITAKKEGRKVAHVEAGLRSRDWTMPEEINRVVTDALSDLLFTTDPIASQNLLAEGVDPDRIHFVGNVMVDTLLKHRERAEDLGEWRRHGLEPRSYGVVTLHRPSNVDDQPVFEGILSALETIAEELPLLFPVHPRTRKMAMTYGLWERMSRWPHTHLLEPLGYLEMLSLTSRAAMILTDSGGLQEEAVVLGVPCITLRDNTERPITVRVGANQVVGSVPEAIVRAARAIRVDGRSGFPVPEKWDGRAAERIVEILLRQG